MIRFHPSPTGSDGRTIHQAEFPSPGDAPDKRIECYQCGFRFNPDVQAQGDTGGDDSHAGVEIRDVEHSFTNTEGSLPIHLRGISTFTASSRTVKDPVVESNLGCPFCGTTNPQGHLRNDDATWGRVNLTDR